jgi:hypothetical protein
MDPRAIIKKARMFSCKKLFLLNIEKQINPNSS